MIDFGSLIGSSEGPVVFDLSKFYAELDVQKTHTEPRPQQIDAMAALTARHAERDLVLKVSTGAGKTALGLLHLYGHMRISGECCAFICPTVQLVDQVLEEAPRLGIKALPYRGGESYPPPECVRGNAILVCTYDKLFNARSTFARTDVNLLPYAIVLDDVHAGIELIRKQFTVKVTGHAFAKLVGVLTPRCSKYHSTKWEDITKFDVPLAVLEVPHWIWTEVADEVRSLLHRHSDDDGFRFSWPYIEEALALCRCVVSSSGAEITPEVLPTHRVRAFDKAKHRLFMSATLADDSLLTRELGVEVKAASDPISPSSDRGLGERMVIAPSLIDPELDRGFIVKLCSELARTYNVVVLTSSSNLARDWVDAGATYFAENTFAEGVKLLRNPFSGTSFAVFAQRFDGVDLPDDACRVLVIDGTPFGETLIDLADAALSNGPGGARNRAVFRVEQGMGRAVRSHRDYAVVLLAGEDLTTFVGRKEVLALMTNDTRNQLNLSYKLAKLVKSAPGASAEAGVRQLISQCLERDANWKRFYSQEVRDKACPHPLPAQERIALAAAERHAHELAERNQAIDAKEGFNKAVHAAGIEGEELGTYLQRISRITGLVDPTESMKIQQAARQLNNRVALPPSMPKRAGGLASKSVADSVCAWLSQFENLNAAVIEAKRIDDLLQLDHGALKPKAKTVEDAFRRLGEALGATSTRPDDEFHLGPDNLWIWEGIAFVVEAKSGNEETLHKSDSGQLHDSIQWVADNYPAYAQKIKPFILARVTKVDRDANFPGDARVITAKGLVDLGKAFHQFAQKMAKQGPLFVTPDVVAAELAAFGLTSGQFIKKYTEDFS